MYTVEHYTTTNGPNSHSQHHQQQQHQQQNFQNHFEESSTTNVQYPPPCPPHLPPGGFVNTQTTYEIEERIEPPSFRVLHHPLAHFESHAELKEMSKSSAAAATYKQEKSSHHQEKSKKTIQTTTRETVSSTGQPVIVTEETIVNEVHHPMLVPPHDKNYEITVQHYPAKKTFNWTNADTYLHIFLTFWFGHFAAVLFFDGLIRNIAFLYILEHTYLSTTVYIIHILFSIALLAFTVWFLTVCWRWWRNKSLAATLGVNTTSESPSTIRIRPRDRQASFSSYVLIAAIILIVGLICYIILGVLDLSFKKEQDFKHYGNYSPSAYMCDVAVFVFRIVFWLVGIVATLMLSRESLFKCCCPEKRIKIGKERPVTVYQVNA